MRFKRPRSPIADLTVFTLTFGWLGPAVIYIGVRDGSVSDFVIGLLVTAFFWGLFGSVLIGEVIALWRKKDD